MRIAGTDLTRCDVGRTRSRRKFLWLPLHCDGQTRWLERATITERVCEVYKPGLFGIMHCTVLQWVPQYFGEQRTERTTKVNYLDRETYDLLYARFQDEQKLRDLVELACPRDHEVVADICCGGGRLGLNLPCKSIYMVDACEEMMPDRTLASPRHRLIVRDAVEFLEMWQEPELDVIFCCQAANYWLTDIRAYHAVFKALRSGGRFVFNTFLNPPPRNHARSYVHDGRRYVEYSDFDPASKMVDHVQVMEGAPPHFTSFRHLAWQEVKRNAELAGFQVDMFTDETKKSVRFRLNKPASEEQ